MQGTDLLTTSIDAWMDSIDNGSRLSTTWSSKDLILYSNNITWRTGWPLKTELTGRVYTVMVNKKGLNFTFILQDNKGKFLFHILSFLSGMLVLSINRLRLYGRHLSYVNSKIIIKCKVKAWALDII